MIQIPSIQMREDELEDVEVKIISRDHINFFPPLPNDPRG